MDLQEGIKSCIMLKSILSTFLTKAILELEVPQTMCLPPPPPDMQARFHALLHLLYGIKSIATYFFLPWCSCTISQLDNKLECQITNKGKERVLPHLKLNAYIRYWIGSATKCDGDQITTYLFWQLLIRHY